MGSEWQCLPLKEAGVELIDCLHKTPPDAGEGYPYVAIPQMKGGRIDFSAKPRRISREDYLAWTAKARPRSDDVVLSRRCNPGETAHVPAGVEFALGQNLVLLRADGTQVHPPFLRWLVRGPDWWKQVSKFLNVGAVFDSLRCADVPRFELPIPPMDQQRAIAHILGTLDDKIELNRRMNETLEGMARALFKSWFVDFDPVRAKMDGHWRPGECLPGLPADLYDLFPDQLVQSELGEVPEGWDLSTIGEELTVVGGGTPSTNRAEYWEGGDICWATPKDLSGLSESVLIKTSRCITEAGLEKISSGLLPPGTVLLSSRAPVGYLARTEVPVAINQGFIAMTCDRRIGSHFALRWAEVFMDRIKSRAGGTTFAEISKRNFRPIPVVIPPAAIHGAWYRQADAWHRKVVLNVIESRVLANLRDTLLPKLISGELRVPDAERIAGGAT